MRARVEELKGRDDTIGAELARQRAAHRARRLELVLAVLRGRVETRGPGSSRGLERAVRDFGRELEALGGTET